ncbi:MAG: hypothetical protein KJ958_06765 [Gammaproteobacteria bacterium]|nr:hypothetical protein [Gammaproteobacteria bacterium]MBU1978858.1 hypothetical protein [Gammaproteobacteria bacterium]
MMSEPDTFYPEEELEALFGERLEIVLFIGQADSEAGEEGLISWLEMGDDIQSARLFAFSDALAKECTHVDALLGFDEVTDPVHDRQIPADLQDLADMLEVDRVVFLMVMTESGKIATVRDLSEVEMTALENIHIELTQYLTLLAQEGCWGVEVGHA